MRNAEDVPRKPGPDWMWKWSVRRWVASLCAAAAVLFALTARAQTSDVVPATGEGQQESGPPPETAAGQEKAPDDDFLQGLPSLDEPPDKEPFADWLEEVRPLITTVERELFETLEKDYQREAFIEEFWKVRDPYPRTVRNELKERWPERVAQARANFTSLRDARAHILLIHGPPDAGFAVRCTTSRRCEK